MGLFGFHSVNLFKFVNSGYQPFVRWVNCKNVFPFCWLPIHSSDCFFSVQKLWSLIRSHLSISAFGANAVGVLFIKYLPTPMSWMILPRFYSRAFMVPGLMFKSLIHLELILV